MFTLETTRANCYLSRSSVDHLVERISQILSYTNYPPRSIAMPAAGGLSRFVKTTTPTNEDVDGRSARAAAAKIKGKDKKSLATYSSQNHHNERNAFSPPSNNYDRNSEDYIQDELQDTQPNGFFEDSTLGSHFDDTISSVQMNALQLHNDRDAYGWQNRQEDYDDEDQTARQDLNLDMHGRSSAPPLPLNHKEARQFYKSDDSTNPPRQQIRFQEALQHRSASPATVPQKAPRKRERTSERHNSHTSTIDQQFVQPEYVIQAAPAPQRQLRFDGVNDQDIQEDIPTSEANFEPHDGLRSPIHQPLSHNGESVAEEVAPDYTDEELKRKRYAELKNEEWGANMSKYQLPAHFPDELRGRNITVQQKLEHFRTIPVVDENAIVQSDREQEAFFEHLSDEDWEAAGDYIRTKTQESMNNMKSTRDQKREITMKYEKMYEEREKLIQRKASLIQNQLSHIQNEGSSMFQNMLRPGQNSGSSRSSSRP
jgi:hypothetical protein